MTMRQTFFTLLLLTFTAWVAPAAADPIRVTYGYIEWDYGDPWVFALRGTGFEALGMSSAEVSGTFTDPRSRCPDVSPCSPGTSFNLGAVYTGSFLGSGTVQGDFSRTVYYGGSFEFTAGNGIVPAGGWVYSPFTFSGNLVGYDNIQRTGTPLFAQPLFGMGRASVYFQETPISGQTGYSVWLLSYNFQNRAPTPEPATLVLVALGAAGVALRRFVHAP
jgi:PEP-CTERM motif